MQLPEPPPPIARAGLRALVTVARADGALHPLERRLVAAIDRHVLHVGADLDAVEPIAPDELAAAVEPPFFRERIVNGAVIVALIDGSASREELATIDAFATALGVRPAAVDALHHHADGRFALMRLDVARRFIGKDRLEKEWRDRGLSGVLAVAADLLRRGEDTAVAERYRALEQLPDGTLGREYHRFARSNGFPLPGEAGAAPEIILFHDCTHVLTGYGTDPVSETHIAAFHAGTHGQDPFGMLLFALAQFHLGIQITPVDAGHEGLADPEAMARAFVRGSRVRGDMIRDWRPQDDFHTPVRALRERFGIEPEPTWRSPDAASRR